MRILFVAIASVIFLAAPWAVAEENYPQDGKIGVQFGPWAIRPEYGGSVARNIVDADNWNSYSFWVEPLVVEVIALGGHMVGGTLTVEGGVTREFICFAGGERCMVDRDDLEAGLRTGSYAVLKLELTEGRKAGPFDIPLEDLSALLFMGGNQGNHPAPPRKPPSDLKYLNPEPEINPRPRP